MRSKPTRRSVLQGAGGFTFAFAHDGPAALAAPLWSDTTATDTTAPYEMVSRDLGYWGPIFKSSGFKP